MINTNTSLLNERKFTYFSLSPSHFDTKSEDDTAKNVEFASVATALARYDLPVPGGYYEYYFSNLNIPKNVIFSYLPHIIKFLSKVF